MKKIYAALALSVAVSASAFAAPSNEKALESASKSIQTAKLETKASEFSSREKAPKKALTYNDVLGYYRQAWISASNVDPEGYNWSTLEISKGANTNEVVLTGIFDGYPIIGELDLAAGTITIKEQQLEYNDYYKEYITLYTNKWVFDAADNASMADADSFTFVYLPDGEVDPEDGKVYYEGWWSADFYEILEVTVPSIRPEGKGYMWHYGLKLLPVELYFGDSGLSFFEYNASEWQDCGEATFTDGWAGVFMESDPTYKVPVKVNFANSKRVMLYNPYGKNSPYANINTTPDMEGYIIMDLTEPDCVLCELFVNSGFTPDGFGKCFFANYEGFQYYFKGQSIEDLLDEADYYGDELANLNGNTVTFPRGVRSLIDNFTSYTEWKGRDSNGNEVTIPISSKVVLPAEALAGVEGIVMDTEKTNNVYFNLQGLRVNNPEKGQIVIVKNGQNTRKTVIR